MRARRDMGSPTDHEFSKTVGSESYRQACAKKYFAGQRPAVCVGARGIMSAPRDHEFSKTGNLQASPKAIGGRIQKHIFLAEGLQRVSVCARGIMSSPSDQEFSKTGGFQASPKR